MLRTVATRLAQMLGLVLAVAIISFTLLHIAPGDAAVVIAGESGSGDPELLAEIRQLYGLDDPFVTQLGSHLGRVATGDFGQSYRFNESVVSLISERIWPTVLLGITAIFFAVVVGIAVGVYTARRPESWASHLATILALVGFSIPVFFLGIELIILFASVLDWLPAGRMRDLRFEGNFIQRWIDIGEHLILPAFTLAVLYLAQYSRQTRASMLETLQSDFVRTARSKGLSERTVVYKHALRNAVIPVITLAGLQLGTILSGALIVETVFDWPGLGRLAFESVLARDAPVLLALLMLSSVLVILANLATDVVYRLIDPRIRVGGAST
ncbi:MAG: ABC transporter permease [Actinomycetota bacterium]